MKKIILAAAAAAALIAPAGQGHAATSRPVALSATLLATNQLPPLLNQPHAIGTVAVTLDPGKHSVCYQISVSGLSSQVMGAHIHQGGAAVAGPVVVVFEAPRTSKGANGLYSGSVRGCARNIDSAVIAEISANPSGYYVNVHTMLHRIGEVRGQLTVARHK